LCHDASVRQLQISAGGVQGLFIFRSRGGKALAAFLERHTGGVIGPKKVNRCPDGIRFEYS
jgi:hypothetical protein